MRASGGLRRRRFECPECGTERTISWNPDLKRFRARKYGCSNCDFVGSRSQWDDPFGGVYET